MQSIAVVFALLRLLIVSTHHGRPSTLLIGGRIKFSEFPPYVFHGETPIGSLFFIFYELASRASTCSGPSVTTTGPNGWSPANPKYSRAKGTVCVVRVGITCQNSKWLTRSFSD
jgi:hypothetical protein